MGDRYREEVGRLREALTSSRAAKRRLRSSAASSTWTDGQVERTNRTLKEATVRRYYCENHDQLRTHLAAFVDAHNLPERDKSLNVLTPFEHIGNAGQKSQTASTSIQTTSFRD